MQHRRSLLFCLIVILTLCVAFSVGAEESSPSITVGVEESTPSVVQAGDEFVVNVMLSNNDSIEVFIFNLDYDTEHLTYVGYENGDVFDAESNVVKCDDLGNGTIKYQYLGVASEVEDGIIVSLTFSAKSTLNPRQSFKIEPNDVGIVSPNGPQAGVESEDIIGNPPVNEDGEIEMHTCTYSASTEVIDPTCTEAGYTNYICSCGEIYTVENADAPALGHTEEELPAVAPTCTETGLTAGTKCSVCGEILVAQEVVSELGHTEEEIPAVAPTCTETGLTAGTKCSVCGETLVAQEVVPALGHTEEEIPAVEATCTEAGLTAGKKCTVCGETTVPQEDVLALDHDYGAWVSNGDNTHTKTCVRCNADSITEACAGGAATCEGKAVCEACASEYGDVLGHNYGAWVSNGNNTHTKVCANDKLHVITEACTGGKATCEGKPICSVCNTEYGKATGHTFYEPETCMAPRLCQTCGKVMGEALHYEEVIIPAVEPTYTKEGSTEGIKCGHCGEILEAPEVLPKKSSAWIWITVSVSVVVVGGAVAAFFILKKKALWFFADKK